MGIIASLILKKPGTTVRPIVISLALVMVIGLVFLFILEIASLVLGTYGFSLPVQVVDFAGAVWERAVETIHGLR
ncbi:MAG: hypothetical protein A2350_18330 [Candidatus Raymondbacteria bacterium RifOxyB12_full_50_8]|uniref:Uncharacterized protein n=1 Tax=Candidatus Raymondbacteria bacterium RIFOXYD12_FULL_49_13 TaxID=1817890 RepID=A0A1F7FH75_UNCRA|nr:MAG: hypothetical protein A2248_04940 [Candidatus Raymondbacteria bacterium RIFOXYA2_FULL_49_16]OGJ99842.1 MAG: hypothetical protein A2350_18330 [Candidatus Raymondbacteria bacterium RifOxyB12_full_50_8]OGK05842.1 MAG: hypothetical protein A2519_04115 [Candidatus Raymondbacteria bacterium RIFOXYD12_FULL_49_13]OGP43335.1 MAG: hypothetical protein A2324_02580 [Candidatus Raymondbacteria bacterium RIFOXYB2_FULL_49_35]